MLLLNIKLVLALNLNPRNMPFINNSRLFYAILIVLIFGSCKPVIYSFNVSPLVITGHQKVHIDWDVQGKPSMEFDEHVSVDSVQLLEYTLIVTRGGKEARRTIQVQKMRIESMIEITFSTSRLEGDTVIASGENNNAQWSNFQVTSISSASLRDLVVTHSGRTATLKGDGSSSSLFSGTTAAGEWIFKTLLTASEKADPTKIPEKLKIKAAIKPLNQ
jgi:hypothetical protein